MLDVVRCWLTSVNRSRAWRQRRTRASPGKARSSASCRRDWRCDPSSLSVRTKSKMAALSAMCAGFVLYPQPPLNTRSPTLNSEEPNFLCDMLEPAVLCRTVPMLHICRNMVLAKDQMAFQLRVQPCGKECRDRDHTAVTERQL